MNDKTSPSSSRPLALVTGASGGIGLHLAEELAQAGHDLVLVARRESALQALAERLRRQGAAVTVIALDLAAEPDALVARLAALGLSPEVLVNNAGFGLFGKHADTDLADEQQLIDLNITALTRLTKQLLPAMLARGRGRILNVASTAAFQPGPYMAVYFASKAYVLSYSEALAEELRGTGVSVTALCPGPTASGFQDRAAMQDSAMVKSKSLPSAQSVARFGVQALMRGRTVAIAGWMNWLMAQSVRFTPRWLVTRVVAYMSRPVGVSA